MIAVPGITALEVPFNTEPCPVFELDLDGFPRGLGLQAERVTREVDRVSTAKIGEMKFVPIAAKRIEFVLLQGELT